MHKFVRNLLTEWRRLEMPFAGETIITAVSGGADSVSLLLALTELRRRKKLDLRIIAAHFNHNLRGRESDADEEFVHDLADSLNVEFARGEMKPPSRGNVEQAARNARYRFLARLADRSGAFAVLTGHTMDDQAETLLINLIRGSGPAGLAGMRPVRALAAENAAKPREGEELTPLVRPLLRWAERPDTLQFCRDSGVEFRTDAMNDDPRFTRVRIRKDVIPLLAQFNPKIVDALARTAKLLGEQAEGGPPDLPENPTVASLLALPQPVLLTALRSWLAERRGNLRSIGLKHILAIDRLIRSPKSGRVVELPGFCRVTKRKGRLFFEKIKVEK